MADNIPDSSYFIWWQNGQKLKAATAVAKDSKIPFSAGGGHDDFDWAGGVDPNRVHV